jgi:hypothetical protein
VQRKNDDGWGKPPDAIQYVPKMRYGDILVCPASLSCLPAIGAYHSRTSLAANPPPGEYRLVLEVSVGLSRELRPLYSSSFFLGK